MDIQWNSDIYESMTPLQWWWIVQIILVGTSLLSHVAQGSTVEIKTDPPGPGEDEKKPRFYQFRKRIQGYYMVGLLWTSWITWNIFRTYCTGSLPDNRLTTILKHVATPKKEVTDSTSVFLASAFFIVHLVRRLYECLTVHIASRRQFLGPLDLFWSFTFYLATGLALVADGPELHALESCLNLQDLSWYHGVGIGLFTWASLHQNKCFKILAKLRRNRAGHIVSTGYKVPKGDWFDQISCPQYFAEILIYTSIGLLLGIRSVTWWWTVAYVFTNQLYLAYNTHIWYLKRFGQFQANRKMLIPFVL